MDTSDFDVACCLNCARWGQFTCPGPATCMGRVFVDWSYLANLRDDPAEVGIALALHELLIKHGAAGVAPHIADGDVDALLNVETVARGLRHLLNWDYDDAAVALCDLGLREELHTILSTHGWDVADRV